jgi:TPR repeat protein
MSALNKFFKGNTIEPISPEVPSQVPPQVPSQVPREVPSQVPREVPSSDDVSSKINQLIDINLQEGLTFIVCQTKINSAINIFYHGIISFLEFHELNSNNKEYIIDTFRRLLEAKIISVSEVEKIIQKIYDELVQKEEVKEKKEQILYVLYELTKLCSENGSIKSKILLVIQEYLGSSYIRVNRDGADTLLNELLTTAKENVILVENLRNGVTADELKELFSPYGSIVSVVIFKDGSCVMGAHITYSTRDDVERCNRLFKSYDKLIPEESGLYLKVMCLINYDHFMLIQNNYNKLRERYQMRDICIKLLKIGAYAGYTIAAGILGYELFNIDQNFRNPDESIEKQVDEGYKWLNYAMDRGDLFACKIRANHTGILEKPLLFCYTALRIFEDVPPEFMCIAMALNTMGRNDLLIKFVSENINDEKVLEIISSSSSSSSSSSHSNNRSYINNSIFDLRSEEWYVFQNLFHKNNSFKSTIGSFTNSPTDFFYNGFAILEEIRISYADKLEKFIKRIRQNSSGLSLLGLIYFEGSCVKKDREKAFKLWTEGRGKGANDSTLYLAKMWYYGDAEVAEIVAFNSNDSGRLKKAKDLFKEVESMTDAKIMLVAIYLRLAYMFKSSDEKTSSLPFAKTKHVYYTDKSSEYQVKVTEDAKRLKNGKTYTNKLQFIVDETNLELLVEEHIRSRNTDTDKDKQNIFSLGEMLYTYSMIQQMDVVDTEYILYKAYIYLMRYIRSGEMPEKIKAIEMIKDIQRIFWGSARRAPLVGGIIPGNVDISLSPHVELPQEIYEAGGSKSRRRRPSRRSRRRRPSRPSRPSRRRRPSCRKMRGPISRGANKKSRKVRKIRKSRRSSRP